MTNEVSTKTKSGGMKSRTQKRLVFYVLMFALPLLQFALFYIYVNFNSIIIAFQNKTIAKEGLGYDISFAGMEHFEKAFKFFFSPACGRMILNSLQLYGCQLLIVTPLALIFSYYIAKKKVGSKFFRVILYLPSVVSVVVLGILFQYIVNEVYPIVMLKVSGKHVGGLLVASSSYNTKLYTTLIYTLLVSFGANVMLYTGSMSGIDQSITESASLDGATDIQEFIHIYVPMIFPTLMTFIITGLAAIFNDQMNLYTFFRNNGDVDVFGYYFYRITSLNMNNSAGGKMLTLNELSALGLVATVILVPVTLVVRKLLLKYGPSAD